MYGTFYVMSKVLTTTKAVRNLKTLKTQLFVTYIIYGRRATSRSILIISMSLACIGTSGRIG
jgi:hypothetical protein